MLQAGNPAAPGMSSLLLLPLGSDRVRRFPPRRTHPERMKDTSGAKACQWPHGFLRRVLQIIPPKMIITSTLAPHTNPALLPTGGSTRSACGVAWVAAIVAAAALVASNEGVTVITPCALAPPHRLALNSASIPTIKISHSNLLALKIGLRLSTKILS